MKLATTLVSAMALAGAMSGAVPAFAQDHMIGGKAVSAGQVPAIQQKCDELRAAGGGATAAGGNAAATSTESTGNGAANGATTGAATGTANATTNATTSAQDTDVDVANLTVAMCDEGGFAATAK